MNLHDAKPMTVETIGARVRILNRPMTGTFAGQTGTVEEVDRYIIVRMDAPHEGVLFLRAEELELT